MDYKKYIAEKIVVEGASQEEIYDSLALPPNTEMGDYALPCFKFAKLLRKSPVMIAEQLKDTLTTDDIISEISAVNGYLNIYLDGEYLAKIVLDGLRTGKYNSGEVSPRFIRGETV